MGALSAHPASGHCHDHLSPRVLDFRKVVLSFPSSLLRPDPPVSTAPTDFPETLVIRQVCARRPGLGCPRDLPCFGSTLLPCVPSPLRREEERRDPSSSPLPVAFRNKTVRQLLYLPRHQLPSGICLRRYSVRVMVRPARLLALLDWSDLESSSSRRGRIHPSLPEGGHPHPESGMTTPSFWGRTMTGLAPAGALPLQAARFVANFAQGAMKGQSPLSGWGLRSQRVEQFGRSEALFPGLHDHLSFLDHVHEFDADERCLRRVKRFES